jgi:hypothetical protein
MADKGFRLFSDLADIRRPKLSSNGANGSKPAASSKAKSGARWEDRELRAQRDRLVEKFTIMQADLGGAFYEMAIRDHVKLDALTRKAAELQKVDMELGEVERKLAETAAAGTCPSCDAPHEPGVKFCAECGRSLLRKEK